MLELQDRAEKYDKLKGEFGAIRKEKDKVNFELRGVISELNIKDNELENLHRQV